MMNCHGYSQNDSIRVSKSDVREAIRQSIEREYQILEINNLEHQILTLESRISNKDSEIQNLESQKEILHSVIILKESSIKNYENIVKRKERSRLLYKIGSIVGIISTTILILR